MTQSSKQTTLNNPLFTLTHISFNEDTNTKNHAGTWNNFQRKKKQKVKKHPLNYFFTYFSTCLSHTNPYKNLMKFLNSTHKTPLPKLFELFITLLLLCSICIAPVMAGTGTRVIDDGVHLVKYDESPTQIDPQYYHLNLVDDVVINGNQFYWIRIGNGVSKELTTVWWIPIIALSLIFFCIITTTLGWYIIVRQKLPVFFAKMYTPHQVQGWKSFIKNTLLFIAPILIVAELVLNPLVYGLLVGGLTHATCNEFIDLKASDGTILLKVDKIHPEKNTLYAKSGLNIYAMNHIPSSGNNMQIHGGNLT